MRAAIITSSDSGYAGKREDVSGPVIAEMVREAGYEVVWQKVLPDDQAMLEEAMKEICDEGKADLLLTTGGTGFSPRDVMPEATLAVAERMVPGGDAGIQLTIYKADDVKPSGKRDPQTHADRQPAGQSEGGAGVSGIHSAAAGSWIKNPFGA